jgi:DnaJ family protein C protein 9
MSADDLYATLGVQRDANASSIKKAYLKAARQTHPDRNPGDEDAKARFQAIGRAYATLSDPEKKSVYDAAGIVDDQASAPGGVGWYEFWRDFYTQVTTDKLDKLAAEYRGSAEEDADLRAAYLSSKGNMDKIIDAVMLCSADDEPRFRQKLDAWIADGSLPRLAAFASEPDAKKRRRQEKAAKEAKEAEELKKKLGLGSGPGDLASAIVARQSSRQQGQADFFSSMEAKYGGTKKKGAAKQAEDNDPLDDAAFAAAQQRMLSSGNNKKQGRR